MGVSLCLVALSVESGGKETDRAETAVQLWVSLRRLWKDMRGQD